MDDKLLILDLDETLIHSRATRLAYQHDFQCSDYYVYKRPYLDEFLSFIASSFEIAIWTSANSEYAKCIISNIFPANYPITFIWSRERCTPLYFHPSESIDMDSHIYIKDLKKIKNRGYDLTRVLVIDDSPKQLQRSYGNLVPVNPFLGDRDDDDLELLKTYLTFLNESDDVRVIEKRGWQSSFRKELSRY
ncbi:HAD family hydrolase [Methanolobus sp.]|jgi:RNA polymerase II subunit A small phosphatase-like protein|uniref:HAD family hydrolase n=1 Tax=Methanolobus sp. TaxID=1874737 RepID=UPI0025E839D0|nr:HAD family hydrolase [Methanolobus sp.]